MTADVVRYSRKLFILSVLSVSAVLTAGIGRADAAIIILLNGGAPVPVGANFRYDYNAELTSVEEIDLVDNSSFFTIYDFYGFVAGSQTASGGISADFTPSAAPLGVLGLTTPVGTAPSDNPFVTNLTWTYTGAASPIDGPVASLGTFSAVSTVGLTAFHDFTGQATISATEVRSANIGSALSPNIVPEPGSMVLLGTGLLGLASIARRRVGPRKAI